MNTWRMLFGHLTRKEAVTTDSAVASKKTDGPLGEGIAGKLRDKSPRVVKGRALT